MAINLLGKEAVSDFEYDVEARKIDIPINAFDVIIADECHRGYSASETGKWKHVLDYFDAVKIGLTATPATHTLAMFKNKVFTYGTEQAVLDGYLVDYDAVKITSDIHINGAFLKEGELVGKIDMATGSEKLDELEDEREFGANLQKIRQFRNRPEPKIVVTVDMLTTGVDIPAIEMVVFMRMVKSRILWVQMLGRGTRLCLEINKEKFTIFDCFDGSLIEYFKNATDFNVTLGQKTVSLSEIIEHIYDNRDQAYNVKRLIKRLRRIEKNMRAEARELFVKYIPDGDMKAYVDMLKENIDKNFTQTMKLLRDKNFQDLLENYPRPKKVFFKA